MAVVVGYDRRPASRAAVLFAGELAGALGVPVHVVHVADISDPPAAADSSGDAKPTPHAQPALVPEHVGDALDWAHVQWTYHLRHGDPAAAILHAADEHAATLIVVGRPQQGIRSMFGHLVGGRVARNLLRHSTRPVAVVPEFAEGL